ncbi:MAG: ATP-binding protein [Myxococcota bacterium]
MSVGVSSAILGSIVSATVAIVILFRRRRRRLYLLFSTFSAALFLWHAASIALPYFGTRFSQLQTAASVVMAPLAISFFRELLRDESMVRRNLNRLYGLSSAILLGVLFAVDWERAALVRGLVGLYVIGALSVALYALFRAMRGARDVPQRKRLSYLFYGGLGATVLAVADALFGGDTAAGLGHIAITLYLYFLYQSIVARRVLDVVEFVGKAATVAVLTLILATLYSVLVVWVGSGQPYLWLFNTLVASFVILIIYDPIRPYVEEVTAKLFFRERYALRQRLKDTLVTLRRPMTIPDMSQSVLDQLHDSGGAPHVTMYLAEEGETSFRCIDFRGARPPAVLTLTDHPVLLQELRRDLHPTLLEQLSERYKELPARLTGGDPTIQRELERTGEAIATMRSLQANVVLPLLIGERLVGFLTVGSEQLAEMYSSEEVTLLMSVADACAVIIESSNAYDKRRERDRLVALGEMAAGMAHEIRNPLGAIKGAAQMLDGHQAPEDSEEFVSVILEEVDRLNGVLSQFLEYTRPYRGDPETISVNDVISATTRILNTDVIPDGIQIQLDLAHDLPSVFVDPEQLKQVLLNTILNAIQVMQNGGTITITSGLTHTNGGKDPKTPARENAQVYLRVRDSGPGIPDDDLSRIFVPFFTTKQNGTGLGLAISQRIIENAGGRIDVSSRLGEGTAFTVRLPVHEELTPSSPEPTALPEVPAVAQGA